MTATQDATIAELERTIAELRRERDTLLAREATQAEELAARIAELADRNTEFDERIEHQSATIDVLKAMSASPGDPQPVFDLIVRRARELCGGFTAGLLEYDGQQVHYRAHSGGTSNAAVAEYIALFPMRPIHGSIPCPAILEQHPMHMTDMLSDPELHPTVRSLGHRSIVALPLLFNGAAMGAVFLNSKEAGGFSDSQIALLQTFAEQAVIAITQESAIRTTRAAQMCFCPTNRPIRVSL